MSDTILGAENADYEYYYKVIEKEQHANNSPQLNNGKQDDVVQLMREKHLGKITKRQGKRPTAKLKRESLCNELLDESDYEVLGSGNNTTPRTSPVWDQLVQRSPDHIEITGNKPVSSEPQEDINTPTKPKYLNYRKHTYSYPAIVSTFTRVRQAINSMLRKRAVMPITKGTKSTDVNNHAPALPDETNTALKPLGQRKLPELPTEDHSNDSSDYEDYDSIYNWVIGYCLKH